MLVRIFLNFIILCLGFIGYSQQTVGVLKKEQGVFEGYTLFSPSGSGSVYLINNCGGLVHTWGTGIKPGNSVYLMEDGSLYRAGQQGNAMHVRFDGEILIIHDFTPHTRSIIVAVPMPAPMHKVMSAVFRSRRSSSSSTVPKIMAPVAPSG